MNRFDAVLVNHGTWMIGGPSFDAGKVGRYSDYYPVRDLSRGHGLRLCSDDIVDCGWEPSHTISIPPNAKPGFYAAKFYSNEGDLKYTYCVTFLVKR
jgi:N,N-dimethylformamidase